MSAHLTNIINQYKADTESVYNTWFINNDKYSSSTSKHQSQTYPHYGKKVNTDKAELQKIINLLNRE